MATQPMLINWQFAKTNQNTTFVQEGKTNNKKNQNYYHNSTTHKNP